MFWYFRLGRLCWTLSMFCLDTNGDYYAILAVTVGWRPHFAGFTFGRSGLEAMQCKGYRLRKL